MRTVRESMRVKILELAMDCTNTRNFIPNTRSSPRMPKEIDITAFVSTDAKVNFRIDITASLGQLVLVKTNNVSSDGVRRVRYCTRKSNRYHPTGAVWVYRMDASRVVSHRVFKAVPMTEE